MSDINFDCPKCDRNLLIDEQGAGQQFPCTHCGEQIEVPDDITPCATCGMWTVVGTSTCPGCGEPFAAGKRKTEIRWAGESGNEEPPTGFIVGFAVLGALFIIGGLVHWAAGAVAAATGIVMSVLLWRRHM